MIIRSCVIVSIKLCPFPSTSGAKIPRIPAARNGITALPAGLKAKIFW